MSRACYTTQHYTTLIRTVTVSYSDARTDTENIRSFMGVSATPAAKLQIGVLDGDARIGM